MFRSRFLLAAVVAAVTALVAPAPSHAGFSATFQVDGGTTYTINDNYRTVSSTSNAANQFLTDPNGSGFQDTEYGRYSIGSAAPVNAGRGTIAFSDSTGVLGVNLQLSGTSNSPGVTFGMMTTNTVNITNVTGGTRTIVVTFLDDGFTAPGVGLANLQQNLTAGSNGLSSGASAVVRTEVLNSSDVVLASSGDPNNPNSPQAVVNAATVMGSNESFNLTAVPYKIKTTLTITLLEGASANFNTSAIVSAPAPAGLILAATALPFAGLLRRRLRKSELATAA